MPAAFHLAVGHTEPAGAVSAGGSLMRRWPDVHKHAEDLTFSRHGDDVEFSAVDHEFIPRACRETAFVRTGSG
jgi:hypothetical protein